jgi:tetratricopeptide (TPR) repeat protein
VLKRICACIALAAPAWSQQTAPLFFSGRVVMEDGTPTPRRVPIETVCSTNSRVEGSTDEKGGFHFQVGMNQHQGNFDTSVATTNSSQTFGGPSLGRVAAPGASNTTYIGCFLRAKRDGYISSTLDLSRIHPGDSSEIGTLILTKINGSEGVTVSGTALNAPKEAQKAFETGAELSKRQSFAEAEKEFARAVALYPRYANAHLELGIALEAQKKDAAAVKAYSNAIAADERLEKPYLRLAFLALKRSDWTETADKSDALLKLNPRDYADGYYYNAVAYINLENPERAFASVEQAVKLDTQRRFVDSERLYGLLLAGSGRYKEAVEQLKNYIAHSNPGPTVESVKAALAQIENQAK